METDSLRSSLHSLGWSLGEVSYLTEDGQHWVIDARRGDEWIIVDAPSAREALQVLGRVAGGVET